MGLKNRSSARSLTAGSNGTATQPSLDNASRTQRSWVRFLLLGIVLFGSLLLYSYAVRPDQFGFGHDDGIYATAAKSLATGEGYRIASLPYEPAQTKYPPFYPFLLSLLWRVHPQFPQNLTWMLLLSIAAAVGFLALTYSYLVTHNYATHRQALIVIGLTAVNWRTIILATSVYSEMVYAALSVAALYLSENHERKKEGWLTTGMATGAMIGLAFLTRSLGVSLLMALGLYSVLKKQWKKALLPVAVGSICVLGWTLWSLLNKTTVDAVNVAYYTSYSRDVNELIGIIQTQSGASRLMIFLIIIVKNIVGLILVSVPAVCLGLDYDMVVYFGFAFLFIAAGFVRQVRKGVRLLHIYVVCYLAIALPVPYTSYDRYLMPLLPFLLLFLVTEADTLISRVLRELKTGAQLLNQISAGFIGVALVAAVGITLYNYGSGAYWRLASSALKKTVRPASEDAEAIEWIKANTSTSDNLVCYRDPLYYLYTGRKGTQSVLIRYGGFIKDFQALIEEREQTIFRIINETNARYLILTSSDFENEYQPAFLRERLKAMTQRHPETFVPVFESTNGLSSIYRLENSVR
jgi:hypothetical protein